MIPPVFARIGVNVTWLFVALAPEMVFAQSPAQPLRERLLEHGASISETTLSDGFGVILGGKVSSKTILTEIHFRILPNPLEVIEELDVIIAHGPPLRNRNRDSLIPYAFGDEDLIECGKLDSVLQLEIPMTQVTDRGMQEYASLGKLEALDLSHSKVTDKGLRSLQYATSLKSLHIDMTEATDASAETIAKLRFLERIDISGTHITEKIVPVLLELPKLRKITVHHGQFSGGVVDKLRTAHKVVEVD